MALQAIKNLMKCSAAEALPAEEPFDFLKDKRRRELADAERFRNERNERVKAAAEKKRLAVFERSAIPKKYRNAEIKPLEDAQREAFVAGYIFVRDFAKNCGEGLVLHGSGTMELPTDTGTGKTHLACAIGNVLLTQGKTVIYCTVLEIVTRIRSTYGNRDGLSEYDVYRQLAEPDLLIVDEVGVQRGNDYERMVVETITDARIREDKPTIYCTNLSRDGLLSVVGQRVCDRMRDGRFIAMTGKSYRGSSRQRACA